MTGNSPWWAQRFVLGDNCTKNQIFYGTALTSLWRTFSDRGELTIADRQPRARFRGFLMHCHFEKVDRLDLSSRSGVLFIR